MDKKELKEVQVTVDVDGLRHGGELTEKGQKLTVSEGQARIMADMGVIKEKEQGNGSK